MNKYNRSKHIKTIELMEQAAFATARLIQDSRLSEVPQLLADSQDAAVALGTHIEKLYGMQTQTVAALEQYCNALYQVNKSMDEASLIALAEAIEQIQAVYDAEFPEKKEVVFMPYNASMWDSLESVWMAARDDESCEVYVVPIPYYDLDANRSIKEFHYEGDKYPDYVPITHYEDYDLELRHPDMIFIHNPYDECNLVTSVAPEFYSSRIKAFTDCLVYIPYFVLTEMTPDNHYAIEHIKHFCTLPGVIHADKVIVQSEDMRQIYINEYMKAVEAAGGKMDRKILEDRILGLGSPKYDKAVNTKKDDLQIPDEWLRIIQKEDGSWKKIIFYNTSIGAFLEYGEKMIAKIKDVLQVFKANQDEVALLWRPHPLMMSTIESMRPDLREEYLSIINQYREEGWGIYDETADMDRAVVLSDAYYGDSSSVVQVYQETGKPVMIQDVHCVKENEWHKNALSYFAYIDIDNTRWISNLRFNGLYAIDLKTNETTFHGRFSGLPLEGKGLHSFVKRYEDSLIFFPQEGSVINLYNMKTGEMSEVEVKEWKDNRGIVSGVVQRADKFLLFPRYKNLSVLEFDSTDKKVKEFHSLSKLYALCESEEIELTRNICCVDNKVWFCVYNSNKVVSFDLDSKREEIYEIKEAKELQCISYDGDKFWLGSGQDVLVWDMGDKVSNRVTNVIDNDKDNQIVSICIGKTSVSVIPMWRGNVSVIDKDTFKVHKYDLNEIEMTQVKDGISNWRDFKNAEVIEDKLVIHPVSYVEQVEMDCKHGECGSRKFLSDNASTDIFDFSVSSKYEELFRLKRFLFIIGKHATNDINIKANHYGYKIYDEVRRN